MDFILFMLWILLFFLSLFFFNFYFVYAYMYIYSELNACVTGVRGWGHEQGGL